MRILTQGNDDEIILKEAENNNLFEIIFHIFIEEKLEKILSTKLEFGKILNEIVFILINLSVLFKPQSDRKEKNKNNFLYFEINFLEKLNIFLMKYLNDMKISVNLIGLLSNILCDKNLFEKKVLLQVFDFKTIFNKVFDIDISTNPFSLQNMFYSAFIDLISNFIDNFESKNKDEEILDETKLISNLFVLTKYLISEENKKTQFNTKTTVNNLNISNNLNCDNYLSNNPFAVYESIPKSEFNINQNAMQNYLNINNEINNSNSINNYFNNNRINNNDNQNKNSPENFTNQINNKDSELNTTLIQTIENIIPILAHFSYKHIEYYVNIGLIQLLKLLSNYMNNFLVISSFLKILANISTLPKENLLNIFKENFFIFCEQFFHLLLRFYEKNINHSKDSKKQTSEENITENDKNYYNSSLRCYFFFYSNIILIDNYFLEKIVYDEEKINFYKQLFLDYHFIYDIVRYEILYLFYNVFQCFSLKEKSFIIKMDIQYFFYEFFVDRHDNKGNKRNDYVILCLSAFEEFLKYGKIVTPKINFIKCEMEKKNIPEILDILQNDSNIDIYESAENIMKMYWNLEEVFY